MAQAAPTSPQKDDICFVLPNLDIFWLGLYISLYFLGWSIHQTTQAPAMGGSHLLDAPAAQEKPCSFSVRVLNLKDLFRLSVSG